MHRIVEAGFVIYVWTEMLLKAAFAHAATWTGAVLFVALLALDCSLMVAMSLAVCAVIIRAVPLSIRLINLFVTLTFIAAVLSKTGFVIDRLTAAIH